jgi:AraC-like DNA-binding protein
METIMDLLSDVIKAYGVQMNLYGKPLSGLDNFDGGLRSRLFKSYDTTPALKFLQAMVPAIVYLIKDAYDCQYCCFLVPQNTTVGEGYCMIGPWLERHPDDDGLDTILRQTGIPHHLKPELEQYLRLIPEIISLHSWESLLLAFVSHLHGRSAQVRLFHSKQTPDNIPGAYSPEPEAVLSMQIIEEIYRNENKMLAAIGEGNIERALEVFNQFKGYRGCLQVSANMLRDGKNYVIMFNSLIRKAVENGYVHPIHIDAMAEDFFRRIETADNIQDLIHLCETMLRRYCTLVEEFSLRGYSAPIRNIINYIDFNPRESLNLNSLAKQFNISPPYLSSLFKRETGVTLTDYINTRRLNRAISLLRSSDMYIQDVAEQCGFLDINYFARLFKRKFGQSPREFRKTLILTDSPGFAKLKIKQSLEPVYTERNPGSHVYRLGPPVSSQVRID